MTSNQTAPTPLTPLQRIPSLDILRGFALLGILVMNIQAFSMVTAAYSFPPAGGNLTGINFGVWAISHIFADQKFMTIFTILFGAGIVLMSERLEQRQGSSAGVFMRRMLILGIIGFLHAHLLWYGDILFTYGICGICVFWLRKLRASVLYCLGGVLLWMPFLIIFILMQVVPDLMEFPEISEMDDLHEISAYRGSWLEQMTYRIPAALVVQTIVLALWGFWRVSGLMLIGMAMYKNGVLTNQRSRKFYIALIGAGSCMGFPLVIYEMNRNVAEYWSAETILFFGDFYNYWGSILISNAYIGICMLLCRSAAGIRFAQPLANLGRTALSNYLLQTILATTIFYGHGFGLFARVDRVGQILIVFGIWIIQTGVTSMWLSSFQFGPVEWVWRSLTYLKLQPLWKMEHPVRNRGGKPIISQEVNATVLIWHLRWNADDPLTTQILKNLSAEEKEQVQRYYFHKDRIRYAYTHTALRAILGSIIRVHPAEIVYQHNEYGKPSLHGHAGLHFNLSHTDEAGLIAVTQAGEVGVDMERINSETATLDIARRFFSDREYQQLFSCPPADQSRAFFRCWTRKEAYIKARGRGLSLPLRDFDVSLEEHPENALLATRPDAKEAENWMIIPLNVSIEYQAALAVRWCRVTLQEYYYDCKNNNFPDGRGERLNHL
jgi:uncharacterized protein